MNNMIRLPVFFFQIMVSLKPTWLVQHKSKTVNIVALPLWQSYPVLKKDHEYSANWIQFPATELWRKQGS